MRLLFLQNGDYGKEARRFAAGGKENYYAQKYSVSFVAELAKTMDVTVLHFSRDEPEARLPSGVRTLGIRLYPPGQRARHIEVIRALRWLRPDHMVVCAPLPWVIGWAVARGIRVLPLFADSFRSSGLKSSLKHAVLARLLNLRRIDWVSNHNLAAAKELVRIGVDPGKVLPFDWPALMSPTDNPAKELQRADELRLIYVGQVNEAKGVGDLLEAIRLLGVDQAGGPSWRATIVGAHDGVLLARAAAMGIAGRVEFVGPQPHDTIVPLMSQHDAVVVPSRHEYPEGLPMTIYEGLCSRSPIVASDHPMFQHKLRNELDALIFAAGSGEALAKVLRRLGGDPALYARLSRAAEETAASYFCPLKFHELISRWLTGSSEDRRALSAFSIATGRYEAVRPTAA